VKLHERRLTVAHLLFGRADTASIAASFLTPPFCPQMRVVCFWRFHFSALFFLRQYHQTPPKERILSAIFQFLVDGGIFECRIHSAFVKANPKSVREC
jgi:hypothetical protein